MLPLKLIRSLVFGETINNNPLLLSQNHHHPTTCSSDDGHDVDEMTTTTRTRRKTNTTKSKRDKKTETKKTPLLLFLPTKELVSDTYRLATIARDMGMDLYPTPSLSHIVFSYPSSSSSPPTQYPPSLTWSSTSLSSWSLPNTNAVPLPFPSLSSSSLSSLRSFVCLSKGLFKLAFIRTSATSDEAINDGYSSTSSNWDCCSFSLFSRLTRNRIDSMDAFSRAMAGTGWTLLKTKHNPSRENGKMVYLFTRVDSKRVLAPQGNGQFRIRELRLPTLDFRNAPLRILHYILLMTDDLFYLA